MLFRKIGRMQPKNISFTTGIVLGLAVLFGVGTFGAGKASAVADCDDNAIIKCGITGSVNFIDKVKANNSGNGHSDLTTIYAHFGLEPADYDRFIKTARPGRAYKDGRIVVDGQTVATAAHSMGRIASYHGSGYQTINIGGTNYYANATSKTFASDGLPVSVLFNTKGQVQFAVINSCGNPVWGSNVTPSYSCKALNAAPVSGKLNTYQFTTSAAVSNNATVAKVVYSFGDGTSATSTNPATPVTHTYTAAGSFTAKVTVYVKLPGNQQVTATSTTCQKVIQIPFYQCVQLTGAILDKSKMSFSFTASARFGGGATFTSADFNFGDGTTQNGVKPAAGSTSVTVQHAYSSINTFNATAVLHFDANGTPVTAATCAAKVTPTSPPTPECKPGVAVGSPECNPCPTDSSLPADSPECQTPPPPQLPNTGAGDVIAIFSAVAVAGFLVYRQLVFRKHRAAFLAAQQGTSPLPLADPLGENPDPVVTPRKWRHRTLRRRRPY